MNSVTLIGRIGSDVELREAKSGNSVGSFRLATTGRKEDETDWHSVTVFGKQAETTAKFCGKGSMVAVEGRISYRQYESESGERKYFTDIIANRVEFLITKKQQELNVDPVPELDF